MKGQALHRLSHPGAWFYRCLELQLEKVILMLTFTEKYVSGELGGPRAGESKGPGSLWKGLEGSGREGGEEVEHSAASRQASMSATPVSLLHKWDIDVRLQL